MTVVKAVKNIKLFFRPVLVFFLVFDVYWLKGESLAQPSHRSKPGSSTAAAGRLVLGLISPSSGSALAGAPAEEAQAFFLCEATGDASNLAPAMAVCLYVISYSTALHQHPRFMYPAVS